MADKKEEPDKEAEGTEAAEGSGKPKNKSVMLIGGIVGVLALAFVASLMAVPGKTKARHLKGPLTSPLTEEPINVNLQNNESKRYLQFKLHCEYYTYDEGYYLSRLADPLYVPRLMNAMQRIAASLTVESVTGKVNRPLVVREMVVGINPVLFPVHIGANPMPSAKEEKSGIGPGYSMIDATFDGYIDDHVLHVDGEAKTLKVDSGPTVKFEGTETDLELLTADGKTLYLDMTSFHEDFTGEIQIGRQGHLQNLLIEEWILQ